MNKINSSNLQGYRFIYFGWQHTFISDEWVIGTFLTEFSHWMSWVSVIWKWRFFRFSENWTHNLWLRSPIQKWAISRLNCGNFNHVICQVVEDGIFLPEPHTGQIHVLYMYNEEDGFVMFFCPWIVVEVSCTAQASMICFGVNGLIKSVQLH